MRKFEDYCGAGLVTLVILTIAYLIVINIPLKVWIGVAAVLVGMAALTLICYVVGRIAYFIMERLE